MRTRWTVVSLLLVLSLVLASFGSVLAQDRVPPVSRRTPGGSQGFYPQMIRTVHQAGKTKLEGEAGQPSAGSGENSRAAVEAAAEPEISAEAADAYGYTMKKVPLNWVDVRGAPGAVMLPFDDPDSIPATVDLPFSFKFYENSYTAVRVVLFGYLTFSSYPTIVRQSMLKYPGEPNNVIAPYWTPILKTNEGDVSTAAGGDEPNRWVGFEWHNVSDFWTYGDNRFHFEVILYENGNILFQYQEMDYTWGLDYATAGIEDSTGTAGQISLKYMGRQKSNQAVLFTRPTARAALKLFPLDYGGFAVPGGTADYPLRVKNTGELGDDVFDMRTACQWPLLAYAADGTTLLTDTDGDRKIDTGAVTQGGWVDVIIKVNPWLTAKVGNTKTCTVTFTSSLKASRKVTANLTTTIPTSFAQAYDKDTQPYFGGVNGYYATTSQMIDFTISMPSTADGWRAGVHEQPNGNQFFTWSECACTYCACEQVMYQMMNRAGGVDKGPFVLHTPPEGTYEYGASAVTAPNGVTGMVYINEVQVENSEQWVLNVFFTALDENGSIVVPPINLSENTDPVIYGIYDLEGVFLYFPRIAVTEGSRFFVTWSQYISSGYISDVYYAVLESDGTILTPRVNSTNDPVEDVAGYYDGTVTPLAGDRVLLAYNGWKMKGRSWSEYAFYAVLNNDGTIYKPEYGINLGRVNSGWMDAVQMTNGQVVMVWVVEKSGKQMLQYGILKDLTYIKAKGPVPLTLKPALTGSNNPSVTCDSEGRAVITWMDADSTFARHLYYAMLGKNGVLLTKPVIFKTAQDGSYLYLSESGNANGPFSLGD